MTLTIEHRDLFTVPDDYYLCHCISADFALGAGIAKKFAELGVKSELQEYATFPTKPLWEGVGYCIMTVEPKPHGALNLVTKEKYWYKPTLKTMRDALECVANDFDFYGKIAMPKIGCGLDRLKWQDVEGIIKEIFANTDIEILVCDWS